MKEYITNLYHKGYLTGIDIHFSRFITDLGKHDDPDMCLAAALASNATGNGDVYFDLTSVIENPFLRELEAEGVVQWPKLSGWLQKIRQSPLVGKPGDYRPLILDRKNRLYLYRYWDYEKKLSQSILHRSGEDIRDLDVARLTDGLKRLFPQDQDHELDRQMLAAYIAAIKRFCIISGGPGTGKTFTMAKILALLLELSEKRRLKILLAAPTGKAAARIAESIENAKNTFNTRPDIIEAMPSEAYTIHRMLKTIPGSPYFHHTRENPLDADVVVVDEASMIDLALMSKLLCAVPPDARLILIGDKDQLASVETGFVLGDICDRENVHAFSEGFCKKFEAVTRQKIDLPLKEQKNKAGLYDCMVVLKKNYRFTGDSGIGELSRAVNQGETHKVLGMMKNNPEQIFWKKISQPRDLHRSLDKRVIKGYSDYLNTDDPYRALELFNRFKILCAVKIGFTGVHAVNRLAEQVLTREGLIAPDRSSSNSWYKGRPVLITRNDYSLKLFNGDMGITLPAPGSNGKELYVYFSGESGELRRFLPYRLPEHETVYAMTVHKSQGSEFDHVLLILPDRDYPVLTREVLYTGITRTKKTVSIWSTEDVLKTTISRKIDRTSGLKDALWGQRDNSVKEI
jgi:exodeoxyribonuclease V alpha subunit